jgi:hypothetical protein
MFINLKSCNIGSISARTRNQRSLWLTRICYNSKINSFAKTLAKLTLAFVVLVQATILGAQTPVSVTVHTQTPGPAIPADFEGESFETANLQPNSNFVKGYLFDSTNTQFLTLFTNLNLKHLRIGGTSTDTNNLIWKLYVPTPPDIDALFRFASVANVKVIFSLRLENGDPNVNATNALYVWNHYQQYLDCFAIGNEPNLYGSGDPNITGVNSYITRWNTFAAAVTNAIPSARFAGPDSAGVNWSSNFADAETPTGRMNWIMPHYYFGGSSHNLTPQTIIDNVLSSTWPSTKFAPDFNAINSISQSHGVPFRISEMNSYVADYPGVQGGNNCFATALFAVDCLHWWAQAGAPGVNIHTFLGKYNGTFYVDGNGNYQLYPIGYGIKAFDIGGHGSIQPLDVTNNNTLNVTAYAVGDLTNSFVTIVNKEHNSGARDANVTIYPEGFVNGPVDYMLLTAPGGAAATNGTTLGGATITNNAAFAGQWLSAGRLVNGNVTITVPASSAAIVRIHADSVFVPPAITQDIPARAVTLEGRPYRYSVSAVGGLPMAYQWFENGNAISGATTTTLLASDSATYDVVITNTYGSTTSTFSLLSIVPQLTNGYARQIVGYHPVGYWPLQETTPPPASTLETNFGTLGNIGNAIYAAQADGSVAMMFGETGALGGSGDSDTAVQFSGSTASYALVPHAAPELTVRPPLTYEAWINSSSTAYGDIVGQGGSGLNSPANSGNFGGIRMGYGGNNSGGPNLVALVYTGNGGAYNVGSTNIQTGANSMPFNQWHHCAMTYDGTNVLLYVDGQLQGRGTTPMALDSWSPLTIGNGRWQGAATRAYSGLIDEVAVYTNVLSALRIATHASSGTNVNLSSYHDQVILDHPLLYYRMNGYQVVSNPTQQPVAINYGSAPLNGRYMATVVPGGMAGPTILGLASNVAAPINGVVSCISAGSDPAFNPTNQQPFSASVWFRSFPSDGRTQSLMSHGGVSSWSLNLLGTNGSVTWFTGSSTVASTNILNDGTWHFAVGVFDGATDYLYIDGALNNSSAATGAIFGNAKNELWLGGDPEHTTVDSDQRYFAGALAHAAFFTNALAPGAVQQLYNAAVRVNSNPTAIDFSVSGAQFVLHWPTDHVGWRLQGNTNVVGTWTDFPGSENTNMWSMPMQRNNIFRLIYP